MTTKTLSTYVAGGYVLAAAYSELDITATGGVGGTGVLSNHFATISNAGRINETTGKYGIFLNTGGAVINRQTGSISGGNDGVFAFGSASSSVTNLGTIRGDIFGVYLNSGGGGAITNGGYANLAALIAGGPLAFGGAIGAATYTTVSNFAVIAGGVTLKAGGAVSNGAAGDTTASVTSAYDGIHINGGAGTVANFGVIAGHHKGLFGVDLSAGGGLTNGTAIDQGALVEGYTGVSVANAAGTVTNFGTILGFGVAAGQFGLDLGAGGVVTNGAPGDRNALIEGATGVALGQVGTVINSATIVGAAGYGEGVYLEAGGVVGNGSRNNAVALIEGYTGLRLAGSGTAINFGTIAGTGDYGGDGALIIGGADLTNGAAGHASALIEGYYGLEAGGGGATVTNFGTISGSTIALRFVGAGDVLVVEAGCAFVGQVLGGGGTLDLDAGAGKLTGLAGGDVTVSGSMAATTFQDFATLRIGATATFASSGAVIIVTGQSVIDDGSLTLGSAKTSITNAGLIEADAGGLVTVKGAVKNTGTLAVVSGFMTVNGAVTGGGGATINGGTIDFGSSFNENVTFSGTTGLLELAQSQTYAGTVTGFSKTGGTSLDLVDIVFGGGTTATYSGTKTGGVLTVTDGTHTAHINLKGDYRDSTFIAVSDGHGGTRVHDPAAPIAPTPPHQFIAAMAGLGEGGAGPPGYLVGEPWRRAGASLAAPRTQFA